MNKPLFDLSNFNLKSFLEAQTTNILYYDGDTPVMLYKLPAPEYPFELTLLYELRLWNHSGFPSSTSLAGIWQQEARVLWNPTWDVRKLYDTMSEEDRESMTCCTLHDRLSLIKDRASSMLTAEALNHEAQHTLFPITEDAERFYTSTDDYVKYNLFNDAVDCFMNRRIPTLDCTMSLHYDGLTWRETLAAIVTPNALAKAKAENHARHNAHSLNRMIEIYPLMLAEVAKLETCEPMILRRKLAECVDDDDMKSVRVVIERDGVRVESKIDPFYIRQFRSCCFIYTRHLDKAPRELWKKHFGYQDIRPEDIVCITYGRKQLYYWEDK